MTEKHTFKFLEWDGLYRADGRCNARAASSAGAPRRSELPPGKGISVRLRGIDASFTPVSMRLAIKIALKRVDHVACLMMRVVDSSGSLVYQEILDAAGIASLPEASAPVDGQHPWPDPLDPTRTNGQKAAGLSKPGTDAEARATAAGSPYTISIWISTDAAAFEPFRFGAGTTMPVPRAALRAPIETYTRQVHDKSAMDLDRMTPEMASHRQSVQHRTDDEIRAKAARVQGDAPGINQTMATP